MNIAIKHLGFAIALAVTSTFSVAETEQLACRGDIYTSTSGEKRTITRYNRRKLTLTSDAGLTAITYGDERPMEVDITGSDYRAMRRNGSGDWLLIHLNRESLELVVSEFAQSQNQKHKSVRFEGSCKIENPVT